MTNPLWIPATIAAATFQVGRNALQRGVMSSSGPWGATLVRFLFGLPKGAERSRRGCGVPGGAAAARDIIARPIPIARRMPDPPDNPL